MKQLILMMLSILLVTSCTSQRKVMDSWLGSTKQSLIMNWGPPQEVMPDGNGGEIFIYTSSRTMPSYTSSGLATVGADDKVYQGQSTYHQGYTITKSKMFYVNPNGKIYHWRTD